MRLSSTNSVYYFRSTIPFNLVLQLITRNHSLLEQILIDGKMVVSAPGRTTSAGANREVVCYAVKNLDSLLPHKRMGTTTSLLFIPNKQIVDVCPGDTILALKSRLAMQGKEPQYEVVSVVPNSPPYYCEILVDGLMFANTGKYAFSNRTEAMVAAALDGLRKLDQYPDVLRQVLW